MSLEGIQNKIDYERELTNYTKSLRDRADHSRIEDFARMRDYKKETVEQAGIFYISEMEILE